MLRTKQRLLKLQYMILDIFSLQVSNVLCGHLFKKILEYEIASSLKGSFFTIAISVFVLLSFILFNVYNTDIKSNNSKLKRIFKIIIILITSTILAEILVRTVNSNEGMGVKYLSTYTAMAIVLFSISRILMSLITKNTNDTYGSKILFIGANQGIKNYYKYINQNDYLYSEIIGYINDISSNELNQHIKYIGDIDKFDYIIQNHVVDEVIIDHSKMRIPKVKAIIERCKAMGIVVSVTLETYLQALDGWQKVIISEVPAVRYSIAKLNSGQAFLKRIVDIVGSLVGLVIVAISFIIFAPLIKIESKGPILFKQERVGKNGRKFYILKYRTMYKDAEDRKAELMKQNKMMGHMFKINNDPRVTKIGGFLRKTSIDELPQFVNVFLGDMSIVGTRPPTVSEVEAYEDRHFIRLAAKPGITGNWQVSGRSDIVDFEEIVELDKQYIVQFTIWEDFRIIFKTIKVLFKGKGAY